MPPRPPPWTQGRKFGVVIDAGSSGSRIQVYSWIDPDIALHDRKAQGKNVDVLNKVEKGVEDGDGWHLKVEPGISTLGANPDGVAAYLRPLIEHAASIIPQEQLSSTPIYLLATAGMRLLPEQQRDAVLAATCSYLRTFPFHLPDCADQVRVISGEEEGLYGWIAVNYLMDGFDKHEHAAAGDRKPSSTYGFLDMGGASTQIAFEPSAVEQVKHADNLVDIKLRLLSGKVVRHPVFVTTWLGYGTNQARTRYVDQEVKKHLRAADKEHVGDGEGQELGSAAALVVDDPCLPKSLLLSDGRHSGYTLKGTGDFAQCLRRQAPLLNKEVKCLDEPCLFNGVHVPPIDFSVNHFIGISEYWYSTQDVWGAALNGAGGVYDYVEFERAAIEYCGREWDDIMDDVRAEQGKWRNGVEVSRLQSQCFKAAWIVNILHEGIGIPRIIDRGGRGDGTNSTEEGISKAIGKHLVDEPPSFQSMNEVNDVAISWTLGRMVLEVAKGSTELPSSSALSPDSSVYSSPTSYANPYGAFRMGDWSGHIPSWRGDVRNTIASVKDSAALPFLGILAVVVAVWFCYLSPGSGRLRKSLCGSFGRAGSPRRGDFTLLGQDDAAGPTSSGDSSGSRTPPRGGRRKANGLGARVFGPLRHGAIRLSAVVRSLSRGRALGRPASSGSILPMSRVSKPDAPSDGLFRPRPIRTSKSTPFLRTATVTVNVPPASGYWNDTPDAPLSAGPRVGPGGSSLAGRASSDMPYSLGRPSSPPPMAIIPPSPYSRPTTPASGRPALTKLTSRSARESPLSVDDLPLRSAISASGRASPSPHSAGAYSHSALSGAVWDSLGPSSSSSSAGAVAAGAGAGAGAGDAHAGDEPASAPGVAASLLAREGGGAKLRASRSANNSQANLAGSGGYFGGLHPGGSGASSRRAGAGGAAGGGLGALGLQASASSTSLSGASPVGTPGAD
ncbi:hypothetical protein JCM3775_003013 [Rhodotorula graminis]